MNQDTPRRRRRFLPRWSFFTRRRSARRANPVNINVDTVGSLRITQNQSIPNDISSPRQSLRRRLLHSPIAIGATSRTMSFLRSPLRRKFSVSF